MAARQFWRTNGKRARRSSGVIQTRSTRRHEAVNISGAARKRRNKSVKRERRGRRRGGLGREYIGRTRREGLEEQTPRYNEAGKSRCKREGIRGMASHIPLQGAFLFAFLFPHLLVIPLLSLRRTFYFATRHD